MNPAPSGASSGSDRLVLSRQRLREALHTQQTPAQDTGPSAGPLSALRDSLGAVPGAAVVMDALRDWWLKNPLRAVLGVAGEAATLTLAPLAQRHPVALVAGAVLVGGLFAWSRPWRWLISPALLAGLMPQLVFKAMARVPGPAWMAVLGSLVRPPPPAAR